MISVLDILPLSLGATAGVGVASERFADVVWPTSTALNQLVVPERVQIVGDGRERDQSVFALLFPYIGLGAALVFCHSILFHPICYAKAWLSF